MKVSFPCVCH